MDVIKITDSNWLVRTEVPATPTKAREKVNHLWIYDRSGSMTYLLPDLAEDLINHYKTIPVGDIISIGYFSGVGVYRFILKGFVKTKKEDEDTFAQIINQNKLPIGTTCFSEIMGDAHKVVLDLAPLCDNFALMFFTDGYPVVPDYQKELRDLFHAIDSVKGVVSKAIFVGYGAYYNRELMTMMAAQMGGQLIHSSTLPEFSLPMTGFLGSDTLQRIAVLVPHEVDNATCVAAFTINNGISQCAIDHARVLVDPGADYVYFITTSEPKIKERVKSFEIEAGMYAAAALFSQRLRPDLSLSVLSRLGDVAIIDSINSAFTNDEFGAAENAMREAVSDVNKRYTEGRRMGYVPKRNRFCVLDLLDLLQQDKEAKFYPFDPSFTYHRIGTKSRNKDGYPEFHRDEKNPGSSITTLSWNETRMNISLLARIPGHVTLDDHCAEYGFSKDYPTWIYRNYNVILDGVLNTTSLAVSTSEDTYDILVKNKVAPTISWQVDRIYTLNLKRIPVMNRAIADDAMTAEQLCNEMVEEKWLEARVKVLKWLKEKLDPEKVITSAPISEQQKAYLITQGIGSNGFSPPKEELPPTDFYMAKEFEVKMAKFSSLPAVDKVLAKDVFKLTPSEKFIHDAVMEVPSDVMNAVTKEYSEKRLAVLWLEQKIESTRRLLYETRGRIYRTKAAVILGKRWFPDLTVREGAEVTISHADADFNFTFTMRDLKVEL